MVSPRHSPKHCNKTGYCQASNIWKEGEGEYLLLLQSAQELRVKPVISIPRLLSFWELVWRSSLLRA